MQNPFTTTFNKIPQWKRNATGKKHCHIYDNEASRLISNEYGYSIVDV
ncbi:MAG: hypothetical protein IJ836_08385 [Spirochaetales bacterium]|nr:hypothetical protein [Spirochaetales bacterium]